MMFLQLLVVICCVQVTKGYIKFATYFQDHMVLQRGPQQAIIWGSSSNVDHTVTIVISGGHANLTTKVVADSSGELDGVWSVKLPAITDPGPYTITASYQYGKISISDVLFGDVWICSGQSNMGFYINRLMGPHKTIAEAENFPDIRIFKTHTLASNTSFRNLHGAAIHWSKPTQASLPLFSAVCWLYAQYLYPHRKYPLGMVESAWGGTPIEAWSSGDSLAKCPGKSKRGPVGDQVLWNSMINPLTYTTIFGVLWYQGENNAHHPDRYACEFPAMIEDWRNKFHQNSLGETDQNFPFGFVQLAANANVTYVGTFPPLRWAQTANLGNVPNSKMPNTFMAVAMDLPDFDSPYGTIHPRYKEDVAKRLTLAGRAIAYKEHGLDYHSPFPTSFDAIDTKRLTIVFNNGLNPIDVRNNEGFEVKHTKQLVAYNLSYENILRCMQRNMNTVCGIQHVGSELDDAAYNKHWSRFIADM